MVKYGWAWSSGGAQRYMVEQDRQIESLTFVARKTQQESRRVTLKLLVTSLIPTSSAHVTLKARHAALLKIVDELHAEIDRLRMVRSASIKGAAACPVAIWREAPRSTLEVG
jgi:hypothetical protein